MLAGDLKKAYQATLSAKQEALAGLEKARGEAAAIRVKANAARVYEKNPAYAAPRSSRDRGEAGGRNEQPPGAWITRFLAEDGEN